MLPPANTTVHGLLLQTGTPCRPGEGKHADADPSPMAPDAAEQTHIPAIHFPGELYTPSPGHQAAEGSAPAQGVFYNLSLDGYKRSPSFTEGQVASSPPAL